MHLRNLQTQKSFTLNVCCELFRLVIGKIRIPKCQILAKIDKNAERLIDTQSVIIDRHNKLK